MFTGKPIHNTAHCAISVMHKATLQDLIKNKNSAVWHLLIGQNLALCDW